MSLKCNISITLLVPSLIPPFRKWHTLRTEQLSGIPD